MSLLMHNCPRNIVHHRVQALLAESGITHVTDHSVPEISHLTA